MNDPMSWYFGYLWLGKNDLGVVRSGDIYNGVCWRVLDRCVFKALPHWRNLSLTLRFRLVYIISMFHHLATKNSGYAWIAVLAATNILLFYLILAFSGQSWPQVLFGMWGILTYFDSVWFRSGATFQWRHLHRQSDNSGVKIVCKCER